MFPCMMLKLSFLSYIFGHKFTRKQNTISVKLQYIFIVTLTQVISLLQNYILSTDTTNNIVTTYTHS